MTDLRWTRDVPTTVGYYWMRHYDGDSVQYVFANGCGLLYVKGAGRRPGELSDAWWAGPLEPPQEPTP